MNPRAASRVAWSLCAFTLAVGAASLIIVHLSRTAPVRGVIGFRGFDGVLAIAFASVGAVVAARRPSNPVGWLLLAFGVFNAPVSLLQQYAYFALIGRADPLPGGAVAAWLQEVIGVGLGALFVMLLLLFPTGRLVSSRWRVVAWGAIAGSIFESLAGALRPGTIATFRSLDNPFAVRGRWEPVLAALDLVGNGLFTITVLASAASVIVRYRRAEHLERQQLKWIAAATGAVGIGLLGFTLTGQEAGSSVVARSAQIFVILALIGVPVAAGVAILRYNLYDIDRIISRTLAYAIVTAVLAGTFALLVLLPPVLLGGDSAPDYVIAVATLVVAALFRPVRRRVQDAVDHRFNRRRYDAERTIDAFTARLREQVDIDSLEAELRGVVGTTMQPSHVSLWLRTASR
jgi:hypothetical protein